MAHDPSAGDALQTINEFNMYDPADALTAYARLRNLDHVIVQVKRGGSTVKLEYDVMKWTPKAGKG